jgi:hypothetical protein
MPISAMFVGFSEMAVDGYRQTYVPFTAVTGVRIP